MNCGCNEWRSDVWATVSLLRGFALVENSFRQAPWVYTAVQNSLGKNGFCGHHLEMQIPAYLKAEGTLAVFSKQFTAQVLLPRFCLQKSSPGHRSLAREIRNGQLWSTGRLISMHLIRHGDFAWTFKKKKSKQLRLCNTCRAFIQSKYKGCCCWHRDDLFLKCLENARRHWHAEGLFFDLIPGPGSHSAHLFEKPYC